MNRQYTAAIRDELKDLTDELQDLLADLKLEEAEHERPYAEGMATAYKLTLKMLLARIRSLDLAVYLDQDHLRFGEEELPAPTLFTFARVDDFIESVRAGTDAVVIADAGELATMLDTWTQQNEKARNDFHR